LPIGAPLPDAPPCILHRRFPRTAGDWHGFPRRVLAPHRGASFIGNMSWRMGLSPHADIFRKGVERCATERVIGRIVGVGEAMRARRSIEEFGRILTGGLVAGDLLWLLVIAFLFAVITGLVG
jgi:hypothetical protein